MGVTGQGRLVADTTPPWPLHGSGPGSRNLSENWRVQRRVKVDYFRSQGSHMRCLGGHFGTFFGERFKSENGAPACTRAFLSRLGRVHKSTFFLTLSVMGKK